MTGDSLKAILRELPGPIPYNLLGSPQSKSNAPSYLPLPIFTELGLCPYNNEIDPIINALLNGRKRRYMFLCD